MPATTTKNLVVRFIADTELFDKNIKKVQSSIDDLGKSATGSATGKGEAGAVGGVSQSFSGLSDSAISATDSVGGIIGGFTKMIAKTLLIRATFFALKKGVRGLDGVFNSLTEKTMKLGREFKQIDFKTTESGMRGIKNVAGSTKTAISSLNLGLGKMAIKAGLIAAAIWAVQAAFKAVIKAGVRAENAIMKLTAVFGSSLKAANVYQKSLRKSIAKGFAAEDIARGVAVATQYGINAFEKGLYGMKKSAIDVIADIAAFSGKSIEETSFGLVKGDLMLLEKLGPKAQKIYNDSLEFGKGSEKQIQTFIAGMSEVGIWTDYASKKTQTMSGLWGKITKTVGLFFTYLSGATDPKAFTFWSTIKSIIKDVGDILSRVVEFIKPLLQDVGAVIGGIFQAVWEVLKAIWSIVKVVVIPLFVLFYLKVRAIWWVIKAVLWVIIKVAQGIQWLVNAIWDFLDNILGISDAIAAVVGWVKDLWIWVKSTVVFFMKWLDMILDRIVNWFKQLPGEIAKAFKALGGFINDMWDGLVEGGESAWKGLKDIAGTAWEVVTGEKTIQQGIETEVKRGAGKIAQRIGGNKTTTSQTNVIQNINITTQKVDKNTFNTSGALAR